MSDETHKKQSLNNINNILGKISQVEFEEGKIVHRPYYYLIDIEILFSEDSRLKMKNEDTRYEYNKVRSK